MIITTDGRIWLWAGDTMKEEKGEGRSITQFPPPRFPSPLIPCTDEA